MKDAKESLMLPPKREVPFRKRFRFWLIMTALAVLYIWTFASVNIDWSRIFSEQTLSNMGRVLPQLFRPDWSSAGESLLWMGETLAMAYIGTLLALGAALLFAFLAAENVVPVRLINGGTRLGLGGIRAFPDLMLALLFVAAVGPSAFAGVLAIFVSSIGMMGKLFFEAMETAEPGPVEALRANGANRVQVFVYGLLPQVLPVILSIALYRFEINIRSSAVLGLVGAGGIGTMIQLSTMNRNWDEVGMALLTIILVVSSLDWISSKLRQKLV